MTKIIEIRQGFRWCRERTISLKPDCIAGPSALPIVWLSANMSLSLPRSDSTAALHSLRFTSKSLGFGKNTSSMSDMTSIVQSGDSAYELLYAQGARDVEQTHRHREEVDRCIVGDNCDFGALILIGQSIQVLENCSGCSGDHACFI